MLRKIETPMAVVFGNGYCSPLLTKQEQRRRIGLDIIHWGLLKTSNAEN
ncbi:MAG: hypothetical protein LBI60_02835 [Bacteroidales bacterium]|nr:hypothetical protein [Bacteroidales bacterium]